MKLELFTPLFLFLLTSALASEDISQAVINGEDASIEDHPYIAKVHTLFFPTCGSAILNSRNVLTAAHCLFSIVSQPTLVSITVGSSFRNGRGGHQHRALRLFLHPGFVPGPNVNDVAVIRTISRFQFGRLIQPISLSNNFIGVGVPGTFVGWGYVGYGAILPQRADRLQKMYTTTLSNEDCRERYSVTHRAEFVVDQKLCVVSGPRTSVCGGDSGGPLVINNQVAGVISWRTFPCGDGLPDVFIRISAVRDWINSVL